MTRLWIRPVDVWLFRDGKPFSAGQDHTARSFFPPTPLTVQGALREAISRAQGVSFAQYKAQNTAEAEKAVELIGPFKKELETGLFAMRGPTVGLDISEAQDGSTITPLYPVPADLLVEKRTVSGKSKKEGFAFHIAAPNPDAAIASDLQVETGVYPPTVDVQMDDDSELEQLNNHWIAADTFAKYLDSKQPNIQALEALPEDGEERSKDRLFALWSEEVRIFSSSSLHNSDYRFGVALNAETRYRQDGQLYQVEFVKLRDRVGLLTEVNGIDANDIPAGRFGIGGENRQGIIKHLPLDNLMEAAPNRSVASGRFKIVFLTPAYFENGWQPSSWQTLLNADQPIQPVSAALYRPQLIGGWNTAARRPRTMHRYVSPGSVYYFDIGDAKFSLPPALTENPHEIKDAGKIGFGQYAVGVW
jgi:CRISPR-associated protein Cmr3